MSISPSQERGRSRRRSYSRRPSSISIQETVKPAPTQFRALRMDEAQIATIKNRKVREFYEVAKFLEALFANRISKWLI
jgi:hypothetical protein